MFCIEEAVQNEVVFIGSRDPEVPKSQESKINFLSLFHMSTSKLSPWPPTMIYPIHRLPWYLANISACTVYFLYANGFLHSAVKAQKQLWPDSDLDLNQCKSGMTPCREWCNSRFTVV